MNLSALFDCCIQTPERLTSIESWHRHMPFACAIMSMLKPDVFVELGTHRGDSYSSFCQAVVQQRLPTRCYAVDTWQGDAHAGEYDTVIYDELNAWHGPRFASFSTLLRMTFDEALEHFPDGSVDLLHIDGLHTYDAVKHDFDSWLPKLSERAVVLFHDTNVRYDDFAVWKLWAELEQQYPAFEFPYGFGLGVLAVGSEVPAVVLEFLDYARANSQEVIDYFYRHGDAAEVRKKQNEIVRLQSRLEEVGSQLAHARQVVEQRDQTLQELQQHIGILDQQLADYAGRVAGLEEQVHQQGEQAAREQTGLSAEIEQLQALVASLEEQVQDSVQQIAGLKAQLQGREQEVARLKARVIDEQEATKELQQLLATHRQMLQAQDDRLQMVLQSRFWRLRNRSMSMLGLGRRRIEHVPLVLPPLPLERPPETQPALPGVTIIVPVYRGKEDTIACIESILASNNQVRTELVVINDASPDPELVAWLKANDERFTLLHNAQNLGFVGTVNRGMSLYPGHDVVLVNSDTEVANDWLDRMQQAAYSAGNIGSVTPFSNNATICSFPLFCQDNELPTGMDVEQMDRLFATANAQQRVDIPTAVGFCMYIRRDCLQDAGLFDELRFGRGYGEENEFCMRSATRGWRHLLTGDVFVYHKGGVSFAETQSEHQRYGHAALLRLFPDYDWVIQQHVAADPAARLRFAAEAALVRDSALPVVLMVNHGRGGGSQRHLQELADSLQDRAHVYILQPQGSGLRLCSMADGGQRAALYFSLQYGNGLLLQTLRALGVVHVHYHHFIDLSDAVLQLPEELGCTYDITVHDFYLACPQVTLADVAGRYCGAPDASGCNGCLAQRPVAGVEDITQWREQHVQMLGGAGRVFVPSLDTLQRISAYFPQVKGWVLAAHEADNWPAVRVPELDEEEPLRVLVLGALSPFKGADVLEEVALQARAQRLPLEFHLLGFAYRKLRTAPVSALHAHGEYQEGQVQELINGIDPHLVWFPGNCPETWSYTLSTALAAGLPVLASGIGAFSERLAGREWSWLQPVNSSATDWQEALLEVRESIVAQQAPQPPVLLREEEENFDYRGCYVGGLNGRQVRLAMAAGQLQTDEWRQLHAEWLHAAWLQEQAGEAAIELLPQVRNRAVRKVLVFLLRRGWLQPLLALVPAGLQRRLKRRLTTG